MQTNKGPGVYIHPPLVGCGATLMHTNTLTLTHSRRYGACGECQPTVPLCLLRMYVPRALWRLKPPLSCGMGACITSNKMLPGRNRLSAETWLGGDNRLGRLNLWGGAAWRFGLVATLALLP